MNGNSEQEKTRIVFAITGASGMPLARGVLEIFRTLPWLETHLIISANAVRVLAAETDEPEAGFCRLASQVHAANNPGAAPASGSWQHGGMVICPCSMASLAAIATGAGSNLIHRAADVCLKEKRPLILVPRESPLNLVHLRNMIAAAEAGAVIMPFAPAFYLNDNTLSGSFRQFAGRILDLLGLKHSLCSRWPVCGAEHPLES